MIILTYPNDGRKLRYFINALLKSKAATQIKRLNYVKSYTLQDNKIHKEEEKILLIDFLPENEAKLKALITKNHPTPDTAYLKQIISS